MQYDVSSDTEKEFFGIVTDSFLLTEQKIIFMNRLDQNKLYDVSIEDGSQRKLLDQSVLSFSLDGENIAYISKTDLNEHRIKLEQ